MSTPGTVFMWGFVKGYARNAMNIQDITHHPYKHVIEERVKILSFYDDYGAEATARAFAVSRATIFVWKKRLRTNLGRLSSLAPISTKPHSYRRSPDYLWHRQQILDFRKQHPGLGKDKIKPLLDELCRAQSKQLLSISTIGRLVNNLQTKGQLPTRYQLRVSARTGKLYAKNAKPKLKKQRRGSFYPKNPGELVQLDCVVKFIGNLRRYVISAIDYHGEFAFSYGYASLSSSSARDFLEKFLTVAPFEVTKVQTDNGQEFYKHFHQALEDKGIVHYWNYPRSPKMNAKIERFNRTVQEEFVDWHLDDLGYDIEVFNTDLMDWLIWYNTKRPHHTLKQKSPMRFLLEHLQLPIAESSMLWTDTYY
ncbi:MAG TPA: integrase core domain-containing protein [Candidatus Dormibacteraeota bacterium]|nr:integrase core domain-containing protein [Candidatus Dormibacteraeota bacterium]